MEKQVEEYSENQGLATGVHQGAHPGTDRNKFDTGLNV